VLTPTGSDLSRWRSDFGVGAAPCVAKWSKRYGKSARRLRQTKAGAGDRVAAANEPLAAVL